MFYVFQRILSLANLNQMLRIYNYKIHTYLPKVNHKDKSPCRIHVDFDTVALFMIFINLKITV